MRRGPPTYLPYPPPLVCGVKSNLQLVVVLVVVVLYVRKTRNRLFYIQIIYRCLSFAMACSGLPFPGLPDF